MKNYHVFEAGGAQIDKVRETCITKAVKKFASTLNRPVKYELYSKAQASVRYADNRSITGNFVIYEA